MSVQPRFGKDADKNGLASLELADEVTEDGQTRDPGLGLGEKEQRVAPHGLLAAFSSV